MVGIDKSSFITNLLLCQVCRIASMRKVAKINNAMSAMKLDTKVQYRDAVDNLSMMPEFETESNILSMPAAYPPIILAKSKSPWVSLPIDLISYKT